MAPAKLFMRPRDARGSRGGVVKVPNRRASRTARAALIVVEAVQSGSPLDFDEMLSVIKKFQRHFLLRPKMILVNVECAGTSGRIEHHPRSTMRRRA